MKLFKCLCILALFLQLNVGQSVSATEQLSEVQIANQAGENVPEAYLPKGGTIVIDANTGQVLFERNADTPWNAASLSKLMTLYLAYEAIADGRLSKDHVFEITQKYVDISQNYALSNNNMILGAQYSFDELVKLIVVPSSNAATILLADTIAGDEAAFVEMMNAKAQELGMTHSKFYNSAGPRNIFLQPYAPVGQPLDGDNTISARDYAILNYHFLKNFPEFLENTNQYYITVKPGTIYEESFKGYQHSLPDGPTPYEGTDGIKTGSSDSAGYNYVSTVKRGETRLILVMLGVGTWPDDSAEIGRNLMGNAISDQVFANYDYRLVLAKGNHTINGQKIRIEEDLYDLVAKDSEPTFALEEGRLFVQTTNPYLTSGMSAPSVAYVTEDEEAVSSTAPSAPQFKFSWLTIIQDYLLVIILSGLLLLIILLSWIGRMRRRRARRLTGRRSRRG